MKNKVVIIAEAGVNHNGDLNLAKKMIDVANDAGVDYVKFQTFKAKNIVTHNAKKASYQIKNTSLKNESQYEMLKKLELSDEDHFELNDYCKEKEVNFFSSAFDIHGLDFLYNLGFNLFKIPSGEITNYQYLKKLSNFGKPVILSTGMSTLEEIKDALDILCSKKLKISDITLLHCNTEYPTPMEDVNLKAMLNIKEKFKVNVGYSDHTIGIEVPIASVALGASIIEKHFTLDKNLKGPDHSSSLEPNELKFMVKSIRNIEKAILGNGIKTPSLSELKNINIARKSIFLNTDVRKGTLFSEELIKILRPGNGLSPMIIPKLFGKRFKKGLKKNIKLKMSDFE